MESTKILLKSKSKIDGFMLEICNDEKWFSFGYRYSPPDKTIKTTKKEFDFFIATLKSRGYEFKEKTWI